MIVQQCNPLCGKHFLENEMEYIKLKTYMFSGTYTFNFQVTTCINGFEYTF